MALRGNLKDFSLPDVFQLVTFSRKTGVLRIKREDDAEGSVWFRDGDVFFAQSNWHTEPLGERLVRAQRVTTQALERSLALRSSEPEDGRRLGQILIDEGYITDKVLEAFVQEQIQETIFDLMRWDEGDFDFEAMPEAVEEDIGLSVSIENIIMEGSRRLEEWNRIKKKIPSMDVVFKMATAPGEGTFEISLKPTEWNLLLLVDGTRSVAEMASDTSRTDFEVARIVYGLFSAGLLEFATDEEIERLRAERRGREALLAEATAAQRAIDEAAEAEAQAREAALEAEAESRAASEAALVAEEESRAASEAALVAELTATPVAEQPDPGPVEEPGFLGASVSAPTAEDAAMLEEMMGAVLQQPPVTEPVAVPAIPESIPYVPGEEPAFMSAEPSEEFGLLLVPVPSVEDLLPDLQEFEHESASVDEAAEAVADLAVAEFSWAEQPTVEPEQPEIQPEQPVLEPEQPAIEPEQPEIQLDQSVVEPEEPAIEPGHSVLEPDQSAPEVEPALVTDLSLDVSFEPEPESTFLPVEVPTAEIPVEPAEMLEFEQPLEPISEAVFEPPSQVVDVELIVADSQEPASNTYERELMALGLGEMPADLLEPVVEEPASTNDAAYPPPPETVVSPMSAPEWIEAPVASEFDQATQPSAEMGPLEDAAQDAGISMDEIELLSASLDLPVDIPLGSDSTGVAEDEVLDFSELLESLDVDADALDIEVLPLGDTPEQESDFDAELLREVAPPVQAGNVISTDAYLDDITIDEMGFSGGMTDELSALTGADRPNRPTASINKIPDEGADGMLHRDTSVDRDTLLKIIEGIKDL